MLPKIRVTSKKASNKSCSEFNFVQKIPRAHAIKFKSPFEKWIGKSPSLELLKQFGCLAAIRNLNKQNFKFGPRNENDKLFFIGIIKTGSELFDIKTS